MLEVDLSGALRAGLQPTHDHQSDRVHRQQPDIHEELDEVFLIPFPNTVVDPTIKIKSSILYENIRWLLNSINFLRELPNTTGIITSVAFEILC